MLHIPHILSCEHERQFVKLHCTHVFPIELGEYVIVDVDVQFEQTLLLEQELQFGMLHEIHIPPKRL